MEKMNFELVVKERNNECDNVEERNDELACVRSHESDKVFMISRQAKYLEKLIPETE